MARAFNLNYDKEDPLAMASFGLRGRKEGKNANNCLNDYARMGPKRTLDGLWEYYQHRATTDPLYVSPVRKKSNLRTYSMRYAWVERAKLYDELEKKKKQKEIEDFWASARGTVPLRDFEQTEKLRGLIDASLDAAKDFIIDHEETNPKTGVVTVYKRFDMRLLTEAIKTASEIQRKAAGLDKNQASFVFTGDMNQLPNEYLDRIIAGEDPIAVWDAFQKSQLNVSSNSTADQKEEKPGPDSGGGAGN